MKTKKEIENEMEVRMERIKQIWTFGDKGEVDYERGYIDCLQWILENFKELKVSHDPMRARYRVVGKFVSIMNQYFCILLYKPSTQHFTTLHIWRIF